MSDHTWSEYCHDEERRESKAEGEADAFAKVMDEWRTRCGGDCMSMTWRELDFYHWLDKQWREAWGE